MKPYPTSKPAEYTVADRTLPEVARYLREHRILCLRAGNIEAADELDAMATAVERGLNLIRNILPLAIKTDAGGQWVADARAALAKAEGDT